MHYGYPPPPSAQYREVNLLAENGVQVTSSRFVVGVQTFPINGITSVSPWTNPAQRGTAILGAILFGLIAVTGGLAAKSVGTFLVFGATAAFCAVVAVTKKDVHGVTISTAGMQHRALVSTDANHVSRVVNALNQAIAMR